MSEPREPRRQRVLTHLGPMPVETFLRGHWQRRPLCVRQALPGFVSPLTPEELAGLSCEPEVESRLVLERGGAYPWQVRHGPFRPTDLMQLPESHWTLLVHELDVLVPAIGRLLERFRFLPNWRIDDVMVSYAAPDGGVGPHLDRYDVFLLQGRGRRRWRIGSQPLERPRLVEGLDLLLLSNFRPDAEWVLEPGDLLYLPPGIPHEGVALEKGMTYSIGLRAPSIRDLVRALLEELLERPDSAPIGDAGLLSASSNPGEIPRAVLERARRELSMLERHSVEDVARAFGRWATRPREGVDALAGVQAASAGRDLVAALQRGAWLERRRVGQLAYTEAAGGVVLFAAGQEYALPSGLAEGARRLCGLDPLTAETLGAFLKARAFRDLLERLIDCGVLTLETSASR